tara:strand:- start:430 stop:831 length:402 start_codon:yes stop_codon:yes gene_type:complete
MSEINQEYVNQNIDKIVEFMKMCEPEKARKNSRNWRFSLLKDYKSKIHIIVCYQNYTECENIKKNFNNRVDKFYDKEQELDQRIMNEEHRLKKMEEHDKTWRIITQELSSKLREHMSAREYMGFVDQFPSYYI